MKDLFDNGNFADVRPYNVVVLHHGLDGQSVFYAKERLLNDDTKLMLSLINNGKFGGVKITSAKLYDDLDEVRKFWGTSKNEVPALFSLLGEIKQHYFEDNAEATA